MALIAGTNLDESVLAGMNYNKREEILERIATDIAAGDVAGANDALFSLAYNTGPKAGQGQGNPNVGKLQSGQWRLNEGETWAEQAVKSESGKSDIYVQRDDDGNVKEDTKGRAVVIKGEDYGKPMTPDDIARAGPQAFLYGTNIPTAGLSIPQVTQLNRQLKAEMDKGDKNAAMNVLFHAVHTLSKAAGIDQDVDRAGYKEFMSRVYDGQFRFNSPVDGATTYAEVVLADPTTGTSDRYVQRDLDGNPTVELVGKDYTGPTSSNIPTKVVTGSGLIDYAGPAGGSGVGTGVGGLLATTPYTQPAPQDWSAIRPGVFGNPLSELAVAAGLPAQQAIFGPQGRAMQPWATGQQVPAGLLNYQIPGGAPANVTYSNPNLGLFDFNNTQQNVVNPNSQQWIGPEGETDFQRWGESEHARMYPGHQLAAAGQGFVGLGATRMNPAYVDWQNQTTQNMMNMGILPAGSTGYQSQDWIDYVSHPQDLAYGVPETPANVAEVVTGGNHPGWK